jgi:hypothetical protein
MMNDKSCYPGSIVVPGWNCADILHCIAAHSVPELDEGRSSTLT